MYNIAIKIEGMEWRRRSTGLLHLAAGFFLLVKTIDYVKYGNYSNLLTVIPFFLVVVLSLGYGFLKKKLDPAARFNHWLRTMQFLSFAVLGILMITAGKTVDYGTLFTWAIICLFLMFTERKVFHDAKLFFRKEGILIPGYFYNRQIFWNNIRGVIARPDFITIFYPDNKFLQYEVISKVEEKELTEINAYCQMQMTRFTNQGNNQ
jgi:hypothetical protein